MPALSNRTEPDGFVEQQIQRVNKNLLIANGIVLGLVLIIVL